VNAKDAPPDLVISMDDPRAHETPPYETFDLKPELKATIAALGWTKPTPIQNAVIPEGAAGRDVMGCSETGSGKTAAFLIRS
jgi:superfamily II DNA/RNA helicase